MPKIINKIFLKKFILILLFYFIFVIKGYSFLSFIKSCGISLILSVISQIEINNKHLIKLFIKQFLFFFFLMCFTLYTEHNTPHYLFIICIVSSIISFFDVVQVYRKSSLH